MRSIWQALAWKEWHEHKWKLASVTTILVSVNGVLFYGDNSLVFLACLGLMLYGIVPIAWLLGASETAGESTRGTLRFTQSLPVPMWRIAICKFILGIGTLLIPIAVTIGLVAIWFMLVGRHDADVVRDLYNSMKTLYRPPGMEPLHAWVLNVAVISMTAAASVFTWTVALGVNRRTDVRAAAFAIGISIVLWLAFISAAEFVENSFGIDTMEQIAAVVAGVLPGGFPFSFIGSFTGQYANRADFLLTVLVAIAFYTSLVTSFALRFGVSSFEAARSRLAAITSTLGAKWLPQPFGSPFRALLWKQWRESAPIVLLGLVVIAVLYFGNLLVFRSWYATANRIQFAQLLVGLTIPIGFLLALIVGISSFDQDLSGKINEFWRSRPIHVDLWFWTKYLCGMAILGVALYSPLAFAYFFSASDEDTRHSQLNNRDAVTMICFHLAIYAAACATISIIRQPVYAAILGVGVLVLGVGVVAFIWGSDSIRVETVLYAIEFTTAFLATLIAWFATRYDWGGGR